MEKRFLMLLLLTCPTGLVLGQTDPPPASAVGSVHLGSGAFFTGQVQLFRQDLAALTPGSSLLAIDLTDHGYNSDTYNDGAGLFNAGVALLPFRKEGRQGPELRLGFLYAGRSYQQGVLRRSERTPYDTLTSSQTGEQTVIDSVHTSTYWIDHSTERFGLDISLAWSTQGRWSLFGGAGLCGGVLLNAQTDVHHTVVDGVEDPYRPYSSYYPESTYRTSEMESFRNGTGWWASLYTPLGVDFRIARNGDFWKRLHLRYELRPQVSFEGLPELGTSTSFGSQMILGLRLEI